MIDALLNWAYPNVVRITTHMGRVYWYRSSLPLRAVEEEHGVVQVIELTKTATTLARVNGVEELRLVRKDGRWL